MSKHILACAMTFLLLVIVGCGSAAPPPSPSVAEKEAETVTEKEAPAEQQGSVVVATPTPIPPSPGVEAPAGSVQSATSDLAEMGMDPMLDNSSNVKSFFDEIHLYAIQQAPDGELVAGAASKWEVSEDHLSWIFTVREGVKFHDGSTMTPEDIESSWNRAIMSPEAENSSAITFSPMIENIRAEGNTVVVRTKEPQALVPLWWPSYEGGQAGAVLKMGQSDEEIRNNPIGAGSFKFVSLSRGEFVKMEAFEDHYCCVPGFKELTVLEVPEIPTRLALLKTGGADLIEATPSVKGDIEGSGFRVISAPGAQTAAFWFMYQNLPQSPFHDKRVREAFNLAIDRQTIIDRLYAGEGGPALSFVSGPNSFGYANDLPGYPYDPERAKQLMEEAGYGDGFRVKIYTYLFDADFPDMPTLSQAVLGYLQELGIQGEVQIMEWNALKDEITNMLKAACGADKVSCPSPEDAMNPDVAGREPYAVIVRGNDTRFHALRQNYSWMHSQRATRPVIQVPEVDAGLEAVAAEFDLNKQRSLFEDFNRMMYREFRQGLLIHVNAVFGVSDRIASWEPISGRTYPNNQWTLMPAP